MDLRNTPYAGFYQTLYADPAWKYATWSDKGLAKSPDAHYQTADLGELGRLPVSEVAGPDCWLFMWSTFPHLQQAFDLARAWSDPLNPWTYSTGGAWGKRPRNWRGDPAVWQFGTGYIFRSAAEPLLVFRRGNPVWLSTAERGFWDAPIRRHSQKPDEVRAMLERSTERPRLELFARTRPNAQWDVWGDEAGKF